jgi:hypothetical protein
MYQRGAPLAIARLPLVAVPGPLMPPHGGP